MSATPCAFVTPLPRPPLYCLLLVRVPKAPPFSGSRTPGQGARQARTAWLLVPTNALCTPKGATLRRLLTSTRMILLVHVLPAILLTRSPSRITAQELVTEMQSPSFQKCNPSTSIFSNPVRHNPCAFPRATPLCAFCPMLRNLSRGPSPDISTCHPSDSRVCSKVMASVQAFRRAFRAAALRASAAADWLSVPVLEAAGGGSGARECAAAARSLGTTPCLPAYGVVLLRHAAPKQIWPRSFGNLQGQGALGDTGRLHGWRGGESQREADDLTWKLRSALTGDKLMQIAAGRRLSPPQVVTVLSRLAAFRARLTTSRGGFGDFLRDTLRCLDGREAELRPHDMVAALRALSSMRLQDTSLWISLMRQVRETTAPPAADAGFWRHREALSMWCCYQQPTAQVLCL